MGLISSTNKYFGHMTIHVWNLLICHSFSVACQRVTIYVLTCLFFKVFYVPFLQNFSQNLVKQNKNFTDVLNLIL